MEWNGMADEDDLLIIDMPPFHHFIFIIFNDIIMNNE